MTKKRAKRHFIWLMVAIAVVGVLTFVSFPLPFSIGGVHYKYNSLIDQLLVGKDLTKGVVAVYSTEVEDEDQEDQHEQYVANALEGLESLLSNEGYSDISLSVQDKTNIRIEVGGLDDAKELEDLIGEPGLLRFTTGTDLETTTFLTGEHVTDVQAYYGNTSSGYMWGVQIVFDDIGAEIYEQKTGEIADNSSTMYIYLGDTRVSSATPTEAISGGSTFISSSELTSEKQTNQLAFRIKLGTYMLKYSCESCEVITASAGNNAVLKLLIALGIVFVATMLLMWLAYGQFGLLADISLVMYIILVLFLYAAIPNIQITIGSLVGVMVAFAFAIAINVYYYYGIKEQYTNGKTFASSVKLGWKKTAIRVLDLSAVLSIFAICLAIFGTAPIRMFALTFVIGLVSAILTSLLYTRRLMTLYLPFNYDDATKIKLPKQTASSEVTDEK